MDNVKNDRYYIQKIRNDLQFIVQHMKDVWIMLTHVACRNDIFWCKFNTSKYKERQ